MTRTPLWLEYCVRSGNQQGQNRCKCHFVLCGRSIFSGRQREAELRASQPQFGVKLEAGLAPGLRCRFASLLPFTTEIRLGTLGRHSAEDVMATAGTHYRQGNIMLMAADELPPSLSPVTTEHGSPLALTLDGLEGPSRHVANARSILRAYRTAGTNGPVEWLEVAGGNVALSHPEHGELILEPGIWRVVRQREFDPSSHSRWVAD